MRFTERLRGIKAWAYHELCEGRVMKAPAPNQDIATIRRQEPGCWLGWAPARMDKTGQLQEIPYSTVPGIVILPNQAYGAYVQEKRFDRYNNVNRPKDMGQQVSVTMLFSVYEPGIRLEGFIDSAGPGGAGLDMTKIMEGTEEGLMTLMSWMDDCMEKLIGQRTIPGTDLSVDQESVVYSLYSDQQFVADRRPIYYGYVNCVFNAHVEEVTNEDIEALLR